MSADQDFCYIISNHLQYTQVGSQVRESGPHSCSQDEICDFLIKLCHSIATHMWLLWSVSYQAYGNACKYENSSVADISGVSQTAICALLDKGTEMTGCGRFCDESHCMLRDVTHANVLPASSAFAYCTCVLHHESHLGKVERIAHLLDVKWSP